MAPPAGTFGAHCFNVTPAVLTATSRVLALATGEERAEVFREGIREGDRPGRFSAHFVCPVPASVL